MERALAKRLNGRTSQRQIVEYIGQRLKPLEPPRSRAAWHQRVKAVRADVLELFFRGHREGLLKERPRVREVGTIETGAGYRITKMLYEGYPGMWVPALLYEPTATTRGPLPVVLNPNGHHVGGKAMDYKQARCINLAKRGMLALSTEFIGMGELRADAEHNRISLLDVCGVAGVGVFYLALKRSLDVLLGHKRADLDKVAVTGLSGGGWQTALLGALDERVRVIVPVAGYSPVWQRRTCMEDIGDLEQMPSDFCSVVDYDVLTAMFAPRPTLLIYNRYDDCCFQTKRTRKSVYLPAKPVFELLNAADCFELYDCAEPRMHNYARNNRKQLYRFLNRHFDIDTADDDLPWEDEILTEAELNTGIPADNATLHSLARDTLASIVRKRQQSAAGDTLHLRTARQKVSARRRLREIIRAVSFDKVVARDAGRRGERRGIHWQHRILHLDEAWSVPVTEFTSANRSRSRGVEIIVGDGGRPRMRGHAERALAHGRRVLAADLFASGEAAFDARLQMVLASTGERPLGIQVGQLLTLIDWARRRFRCCAVHLIAMGTVLPVAALMATALAPEHVSRYRADGLMVSLHRLIEWPVPYDREAPLFCFGLLAEFDLPDLVQLAAPVPIRDQNRGPITRLG